MTTILDKIEAKYNAAHEAAAAAKQALDMATHILALSHKPMADLTDDEHDSIMRWLGDASSVVATEPVTRPRIKPSDKGSKPWNEGRKARDGGPVAECPYAVETSAAKGWFGGFDERSAEMAAATTAEIVEDDKPFSFGPLPESLRRTKDGED